MLKSSLSSDTIQVKNLHKKDTQIFPFIRQNIGEKRTQEWCSNLPFHQTQYRWKTCPRMMLKSSFSSNTIQVQNLPKNETQIFPFIGHNIGRKPVQEWCSNLPFHQTQYRWKTYPRMMLKSSLSSDMIQVKNLPKNNSQIFPFIRYDTGEKPTQEWCSNLPFQQTKCKWKNLPKNDIQIKKLSPWKGPFVPSCKITLVPSKTSFHPPWTCLSPWHNLLSKDAVCNNEDMT